MLENMLQNQPKYKQKNTLFIVSSSTGKERDSETGFSYFGARYYDSDLMTGWLSVDPLADKYPSLSPYNYCAWNPIRLVDPDGNEQGIPPYLIGYLMENYGKSSTIKELGFIIMNPHIGYNIGKYSPNSKNISTIASNFEINICRASNLERGNPGDYGNAIRHTLWQSIICNEFGTDIAIRVGNVHESGKSSSLTTINRIFKGDFGKESADQVADLLNNAIGREIATNNVGLSNKKYAEKVIERFYTKGLYVVKSDGDNHSVQLVKLTKQQYESAIQEIKKLKEYGKEN